MRHRLAGRGFGRNTNHRKALLRNIIVSLFEHLKIETTVAKAKEAKSLAERVITLGKKGDLQSRRLALSKIPNNRVVSRLFNEIAPSIQRSSGYLRIVRTRFRPGDNADMAILEFVDYDALKGEKKEKKGKKPEKDSSKSHVDKKDAKKDQ